jgi:cytoskeletal protein CcmA (bactofilin family)
MIRLTGYRTRRDSVKRKQKLQEETPQAMSSSNDRTSSRRHRRFSDAVESFATLIGQDVTIRGELAGATNVDLDGRVEGELKVDGFLWLRPEGRVIGVIWAHAVVVEGTINGDLRVRDALELRPGCKVEGDIVARKVAIVEGAFFEGGITMDGEEVDRDRVGFSEKRTESD